MSEHSRKETNSPNSAKLYVRSFHLASSTADMLTNFKGMESVARNNKIPKISAIILVALILYFAVLMRGLYPLQLTESEGYLAQIPARFWITLVLSILVLCGLAITTTRAAVSLLLTICFYLLFSSYQFLFRGLFGGDYTPTSRQIVLQTAIFDPDLHFDYLQWPNKYLMYRTQHLILDLEGVLINVEVTFLVLVIMFSISVWTLTYQTMANSTYAFFGAVLFLVIVHSFLNFQSVPQFFALILLIFLFSVHVRNGKRWLLVKLVLFIALVLSHPMLFIFYIGAIFLYPIFKGIWCSFEEFAGGQSKPLYSVLVGLLKNPLTFSRLTLRSSWVTIRDRSWLFPTILVISVYLFFYLYRFITWQTTMIASMFLEPEGHSIAFVNRILEVLGIESADTTSSGAISTQRVYYLTSTDVSSFTSSASMIIVAAVGFLLLGLFLTNDYAEIKPFHIAIGVGAFGYFLAGIAFDILGMRSFQILFLPFITSIMAMQKFNKQKGTLAIIAIVIIILISPVLVANSLDNATVTAGHSTGDYYSEEAGQWITDYGSTPVLQARSTTYPIETAYGHNIENSWQSFGDRDTNIVESNSAHLIQFDFRLYHSTYYFRHGCNFNEQPIVYNNGNPVMWDQGGEFTCSQINDQLSVP